MIQTYLSTLSIQILQRKRSLDLIAAALSRGHGVISFQVVQEFLNLALRKFSKKMTAEQARTYFLKALKPLCQIHSSPILYSRALTIHEQTKYSWYDCLIIASALEASCDVLYSEDLQNEQNIDGLTVVNPFE